MSLFSHWNILIVDDEADNCGVLELVFRFYGATPHSVESGSACLAYLQDHTPSLILLDIQMPGLSGYEVLRALRSDPRWQHIPVVAVTAYAMSGDGERILEAGFDGYIPKPISAMTVAQEVAAILESKPH